MDVSAKYLKDGSGDIFSPVTSAESVFSSAGSRLIDMIYPVGSIYMSVNNINPGTYLLNTTWVSWSSGRVPVGVNTADTNFNTVEKTGGASTHTLSTAQIPAHTHGSKTLTGQVNGAGEISRNVGTALFSGASGICSRVAINTWAAATSVGTSNGDRYDAFKINATHEHTSVGSGQAHNNLQPYITCYMWKRTA